MNYYRRYVGDYLRDTSRLSMLEHGAYNLLLDYYYAEERPIPADLTEVYRMVRALMPDERRAIDKVLTTYFVKREDGWHNTRVDEEIAIALTLIETAKENGKLGGRPRKNPDHNPEDNQQETQNITHNETQRVTAELTQNEPVNNHPPTTNLQPPTSNHHPTSKAIGSHNGARHAKVDDSPVSIGLPLREGADFEVRQSLVTELGPLYPAVDIPATLREMRGWLVLNTERRKTRRGIRRFICNWLQSEQEKHGG